MEKSVSTTTPVQVGSVEVDAATLASALKANINISVVYNKKTYKLKIVSKTETSGAYGLLLEEENPVEGKEPEKIKLAQVAIKDKSNWAVDAALPPGVVPTIGGVTLKNLNVQVGEGEAHL